MRVSNNGDKLFKLTMWIEEHELTKNRKVASVKQVFQKNGALVAPRTSEAIKLFVNSCEVELKDNFDLISQNLKDAIKDTPAADAIDYKLTDAKSDGTIYYEYNLGDCQIAGKRFVAYVGAKYISPAPIKPLDED